MAGGFVSVVTRVKNVLLNLFVVHFVTSTEWKTDCKIIYNIRKKSVVSFYHIQKILTK